MQASHSACSADAQESAKEEPQAHMLRCPVVLSICFSACRIVWLSTFGAPLISMPDPCATMHAREP